MNKLLVACISSFLILNAHAQSKMGNWDFVKKEKNPNTKNASLLKRSSDQDRPQRIVRSQWNNDSADWLYFKDTTFKSYYTNGLQSSERVVFPSEWSTYTTYTEYMYDGAGRMIRETYFTVKDEDGSKDTSSMTDYIYNGDVLQSQIYKWRSAGSTEWEEIEETRHTASFVPNTDLVATVYTEFRSSDNPIWEKQQRLFFEYNSKGAPNKITKEMWEESEQNYLQAAVYDSIVWKNWIKNDHTLENSEYIMVEGSVLFLGMGRIRLRCVYDEHDNIEKEITYFLNQTDSIISDGTLNTYTYDAQGRTLTQLEKYWDEDEMDYVNESYFEFFDYYAPTALDIDNIDFSANVYPNPAQDKLYIKLEGLNIAQLVIRDLITGKSLINTEIQSEYNLSLEGFHSGMYTYEIHSEKGVRSGKWIKN